MTGDRWTLEEDEILRKYYKTKTDVEISKMVGRSASCVAGRRKDLSLSESIDWWSPEEIQILKKMYRNHSFEDLEKALPKRSRRAISQHGRVLGLKREFTIKRWTEEEVEILRKNYPTYTQEEILKKLPRHPWRAIVNKAWTIKVRRKFSRRNPKLFGEIVYLTDVRVSKSMKEFLKSKKNISAYIRKLIEEDMRKNAK